MAEKRVRDMEPIQFFRLLGSNAPHSIIVSKTDSRRSLLDIERGVYTECTESIEDIIVYEQGQYVEMKFKDKEPAE